MGVINILQESFPMPLPSGPAEDPVCGNVTEIDAHICGPTEVMEYYKYLLGTDNPEKVPNTRHCQTGLASPACSPGFFDSANEPEVEVMVEPMPHACCPGYFCPPLLTCMIPCPNGAYCPRAFSADPPDSFKAETQSLPEGSVNRWCAPYAYKERAELGCGGADKWTIVPEGAFPGVGWAAGSGNLYCDGGTYCPNSTFQFPCPEGYYCKRGSSSMQRCPPLMKCGARAEIPDENYSGVIMDACLFLGLWLLWHLSRWYNRMMRRMNLKERLRMAGQHYPAPSSEQVFSMELIESVVGPRQDADAADLVNPRGFGRESTADHSSPDQRLMHPMDAPLSPGGSTGPTLGSSPTKAMGGLAQIINRLSPAKKGRPHSVSIGAQAAPVWASFGGPAPELGEYGVLGGDESVTDSHRTPERRITDAEVMSDGGLSGYARDLLASPRSSVHGGVSGHRSELHIEFSNLGLRLKATGKKVLAGVTGQLRDARLTAIMGPSGAGKTSLMSVLAGKASYGEPTGVIRVNGDKVRSLERYKRVMGFVPQDDIMHANLTVEENLLFSAQYRLPAHFTRAQHLYYVERAVQVLQLDEVRNEVIGDEETRGISGGQRKRVNVGLELVADPSLLFLDEPTSGLDSTSSRMVIAALQQVAHMGVTVAAVIHQPSYQVFHMFDDILLLCKGGRTVYYGPERDVIGYFEGLGYELPSKANPADVFMDIIAGQVSTRPGVPADTPQELAGRWDAHCGAAGSGADNYSIDDEGDLLERTLERTVSKRVSDPGEDPSWRERLQDKCVWLMFWAGAFARDQMDIFRFHMSNLQGRWDQWRRGEALLSPRDPEAPSSSNSVRPRGVPARSTPGFRQQYMWCLSRAVLQRTREPLSVFTDYAIFALTGSMLGNMSDRGRGTIMHFDVDTLYNNVALGLLSTVSALRTFGEHRVVFFRESSAGLNKLAYFLALDTFDHSGTLMRSAVYLILYYSFAQPRAVIWQMYLVTVGIVYACTGTAYLLSQIMEPAASQLSSAIFSLICALNARKHSGPGLMGLAHKLSFARWGLEGFIISEANRLTGVWLLARCADLEGLNMDVTRFHLCLVMLVFIGLFFRSLACAGLYLLHRDKRK
ncbi:hypothetical protein WJX72_003407 [[Myrmecia] bisecta]|uniref:ABC transporter domain-containing protein n=1 Tax=[Myrmecia] bisecta TaxID=41462 RepID=A0AAW1Q3P8_9CHLO